MALFLCWNPDSLVHLGQSSILLRRVTIEFHWSTALHLPIFRPYRLPDGRCGRSRCGGRRRTADRRARSAVQRSRPAGTLKVRAWVASQGRGLLVPSALPLMFAKPTLMSLAQNGTSPQRITSRVRSLPLQVLDEELLPLP